MRIEEMRGVCRCGKCDGTKLFGAVVKVDNEEDSERLQDFIDAQKSIEARVDAALDKMESQLQRAEAAQNN